MVIPSIIIIAYLLFYTRLLFGGADAKAMMAVAIIVPFKPEFWQFPLWEVIINDTEINFPAPYIILTNSVLIFIIIPLAFFIYNIIKRDIESPYIHCFLGYKMEVDKAMKKFVWPMNRIENGEEVLVLLPKKGLDTKKEIEKLKYFGRKEVWVTPKTPFIVALFFGYIGAFLLGDLMLKLIGPILI